jgi:uroporphyrinogen-III decarboxylase
MASQRFDYLEHNEDVKKLWAGYRAGRPTRVPVVFHINSRVWLLNPQLNTKGYTFKDYYERPEVALETELHFQKWRRLEVMEDVPKGLPEKWHVAMCGQNVVGGGWLGSEVVYRDASVPHVKPLLAEKKELLYQMEQPDVRANFMRYAWAFYEYGQEKIREGYEFEGRPLAGVAFPGMEPPFCLAYVLRGATELLIDMYEDPDYFHRLMNFVTEAYLRHQRAMREVQKVTKKPQHAGIGDDPIEMISVADYNARVLPYHKRVLDETCAPAGGGSASGGGSGPHFAHLCGRAQHHFANLREKLNVWGFDTGFPTDLAKARRELGPAVTLWGNIHVSNLMSGTMASIAKEVKELLSSGVMHGGRFILGDGNNVAEGTPVENLNYIYELAKLYGQYREDQYIPDLKPLFYPYVAG